VFFAGAITFVAAGQISTWFARTGDFTIFTPLMNV
jgi:hypothetical protein